ncbi:MAG TPA: hypothetical protein VLF40_01000 [Candidatus Saccharimonadales bacterium]|nr:hypothetical protein [Candidatus Saccharimonadales bacterium]
MNETIIVIAACAVLLILIMGTGFLLRRRPKVLNQEFYAERWQTLQKLCKDKSTWPLAIIDADKLLDDALKKRRYRGKTMGERLVAAQRDITSNDEVWFGHKLRNRLVHENNVSLTEKMVKEALIGIRGALKDLGALK